MNSAVSHEDSCGISIRRFAQLMTRRFVSIALTAWPLSRKLAALLSYRVDTRSAKGESCAAGALKPPWSWWGRFHTDAKGSIFLKLLNLDSRKIELADWRFCFSHSLKEILQKWRLFYFVAFSMLRVSLNSCVKLLLRLTPCPSEPRPLGEQMHLSILKLSTSFFFNNFIFFHLSFAFFWCVFLVCRYFCRFFMWVVELS